MTDTISNSTALRFRTRQPDHAIYRNILKRAGDLLLCFILLPILLPVIGIMYFFVRLQGGPGFFGHTRVGRSGQPFKCWKMRTMMPNAQEKLETLLRTNADARAEWAQHRKLRNDPRVTRFGLFLRQSSLDELPQVWNVLRGEMSFVGPRPVTKEELQKYGSRKRAYLAMRPGITGLWQVSGRNNVTYDARVRYDVTYHEDVSWLVDTHILIRTLAVVIARNGM